MSLGTGVFQGLDAVACGGIGYANRKLPVLSGNTFGSRIRAGVSVKGAVFLHDDDYMLDLVNVERASVVPITVAIFVVSFIVSSTNGEDSKKRRVGSSPQRSFEPVKPRHEKRNWLCLI
jgi:hypothetical protein